MYVTRRRGLILHLVGLLFSLTFVADASLAQDWQGFLTYQAYSVGDGPNGVVAADFNGDGRVDFASANTNSGSLAVYLAQEAREFGTRTDYSTGYLPYGIVCGDFNADQVPDLVVSNGGATDLSLLYGAGDGSFLPEQRFGFNDGWTGAPRCIATGDFDANGLPDLAVAYSEGGKVCVFPGCAGGGFASATPYTAGQGPWGIVAADFNGDNLMDLAVSNNSDYPYNISVFNGMPGGTFADSTSYSVGQAPVGLAAADFNDDGRVDLAVANSVAASISVYYAQPDGTLGGKTDFEAGGRPSDLVAGDFDEDGIIDLAFTVPYNVWAGNQQIVSLLHGMDNGAFGNLESYTVDGTQPYGIAVSDLDMDGHLDLLVTSYKADSVSLLYNSIPEPATLSLLAVGALALIRRRRK